MGGYQYYNVFGKQVASQYLAMATLATIFGGAYAATGGSKKAPVPGAAPPINASSSDEADFIKKFLEQADEKKEDKH